MKKRKNFVILIIILFVTVLLGNLSNTQNRSKKSENTLIENQQVEENILNKKIYIDDRNENTNNQTLSMFGWLKEKISEEDAIEMSLFLKKEYLPIYNKKLNLIVYENENDYFDALVNNKNPKDAILEITFRNGKTSQISYFGKILYDERLEPFLFL